ncbi:MAG TPA: outer membrane beta-barrel protein [Candidatus Sulfotelmatobacter sp.]|nr:outer membrane beta-barrel protein [Candidatus Sulfotelmatobacter sp.]
MRKFGFLATLIALLVLCSLASAQQGDAYIGGGTLLSSSASSSTQIPGTNCGTNSQGGAICPEKGGTYLNLGADVIFKRRLGAAFDINWKASQGAFGGPGGQPYRPLLFTFNGVFQPRLGKKAGLDLFGGIGWQSTRFYGYQPTSNCVYFGACYTSSNHFLVDIGGGIRYYVWGHMFLRPEVRVFHILNNSDNFTSNNIFRVGASIGYTIGPD